MRFIIIHPSRRPEKANKTVDKWFDRYDNNYHSDIEYVLSLDSDDAQLNDYMPHSRMDILISPNENAVQAVNAGAQLKKRSCCKSDILMVVSDDTDCPDKWNRIIGDAIAEKSDFLLRVSDGLQKRICTLPIMDRAYYNRFGYIYNPIYTHAWCDTELTEVAYKLGRIIVRNDIEFKHLHPEVTKEPKDDLYKRNDLTHDRDRPLYESRKRINFGL